MIHLVVEQKREKWPILGFPGYRDGPYPGKDNYYR